MHISEIAAALSGLAVAVGGLTSLLVMRVQRDMARLKIEILDGINGKYIGRREAELIRKQDEQWKKQILQSVEDIQTQHQLLNQSFIACRAAHRGIAGSRE